ncbi:MAG: hypothetical protein IT437_08320 [Phycisphaerales bacterium]|nr:hypothetical protein [Phycisphaerales bacterium]
MCVPRLILVLLISGTGFQPVTAQDSGTGLQAEHRQGAVAAEPHRPDAGAAESQPLGPARPAATASEPSPPPPSAQVGRTIWSLTVVLALVVVAGIAVRTAAKRSGGIRASLGAGGRSPAGLMEILGRYPVGRGTTLVLLRLERRILLLSQSSTGRLGLGATFSTLTEITDPEEVAAILTKSQDEGGESTSARFRSFLSAFDRALPTDAPTLRPSRATPAGDRVEVWDARADIPVVDLTGRSALRADTAGPIGTLRKRLGALRVGGGGAA